MGRFDVKKLLKSGYAKDASTLMIGTTLGMLITTVATPILSRLYDDVTYGTWALFVSTFTILTIVATLRYELAILLPKDDRESFGVMLSSCTSTTIFSVLCLAFTLSVTQFDIPLFGLNKMAWLNYLPAMVLINGLHTSFNYWMNRRKRYFNLSINRVLQTALILGFSVLFSEKLLGIGNGMIVAYIIAYGVVTLLLFIYVVQDYRRLSLKCTFKDAIFMAKRYRRFPLNTMPTGLINNFAVQMPVYILSAMFGEGVAGQYSMMNSVLGLPISVVGQAITDVFRQKASQEYAHKGECKKLYYTTALALMALAVVPFGLLMIFARPVFTVFLGDEWLLAGTFVTLLAPFYFIRLVVSPLTNMTIIAEKQTFELIWQSVLCVLTSGAMFAAAYFTKGVLPGNFPYYAAICAYALIYSAMYIYHFTYTRRLAAGKKLWG